MQLVQAPESLRKRIRSVGYRVSAPTGIDDPSPLNLETIDLPMLKPDFEIRAGEEHGGAVDFMKFSAEMVRCMVGPCVLLGGPDPFVFDDGRFVSVTSSTLFLPCSRPGSNLLDRQPCFIISTALAGFRPTPTKIHNMRIGKGKDFIPPSSAIGVEELLLQVGGWASYEANQIWPDWTDRVWQSLKDDADPSVFDPGQDKLEAVLDSFVEFAVTFLRNAALARSAVADGVPFHTREFARIVTGIFAREISEKGNLLWPNET